MAAISVYRVNNLLAQIISQLLQLLGRERFHIGGTVYCVEYPHLCSRLYLPRPQTYCLEYSNSRESIPYSNRARKISFRIQSFGLKPSHNYHFAGATVEHPALTALRTSDTII
jgi:hypothetical protein